MGLERDWVAPMGVPAARGAGESFLDVTFW